jgi:predicted transcriptional regulator
LKVIRSTAPICMENPESFSIIVLDGKGAHRRAWTANETDCPTPGVVTVFEHGRVIHSLKEGCSLRAVILTVLPQGKAEGTRRDPNSCTS